MIFRFRHLLLGLLAVLLLLIAGLWLARQPLMHNVLRPWVAAQATRALGGEVLIESLTLDWNQIELLGLDLVREDVEVHIDSLRIGFTIGGLLLQRLAEVVVKRPDVRMVLTRSKAGVDQPLPTLPRQAPFEVTAWSLVDGRLQVASGEESYLVQNLAANGRLGKELHFASSARVGAGEGVAVFLAGDGRWQDGLELTLEKFVWGDQPLLTNPVTVRPGDTNELAVSLTLPGLSDVETATLFTALGRPVPWPEGLQWQVAAPSAALRLVAGVPQLQVTTDAGTMTYEGRAWSWDTAGVELKQAEDAWQFDARLGVATDGEVSVQGTWRDDTFTGRVDSSVPQPALLAAAFGVTLPAEARQGRNLVLSAWVLASQKLVRVSDGRVSLDWSGVGKLAARFQGDWHEGKVTTSLEGVTLAGQQGKGVLATAAITASGDLAAGTWQGDWQVAGDDLLALVLAAGGEAVDGLPNLRQVRLSGQFKVKGENFRLPEVKLAGQLKGKGLSGRLQGRLEVAHHPAKGTSIDLQELLLAEIEYSNADGTVVAVGGRLSLAGQVRPGAEHVVFDLRGRGSLQEALAGSWYGSLKDLPLGFTARGRWLLEGQIAQFEQARFDFDGLAVAELAGRFSTQSVALEGQLKIKRLSGRFLETLKHLGGELAPALKDVELDGALAVQARVVRQGDAWRLDMDIQPDGLTVGLRDAFTLSGLSGVLPFIVESGELSGISPKRSGRLSWTGLTASLVDTASGRLELQAAANRWQLVHPLVIAAAGGRVRLNDLKLSWRDTAPVGEASLNIEDVDLIKVSREFAWPELGGRFSADLAGIRFSREEIVTSGGASARAFGGRVALQNLKVLAPLSRYPTYHADVDFNDINLQELTRTFAFGEINGVASGYVHGLRMFDGIPSAFDARFDTAEDGTRNISVKAIRNLNTLSHGGLSAALSQGVYRFIDFYRYRKIGLTCSLRNDAFRLRGTARTESDKHLIDGGWLPPKIDVIISSPVISFKEMVKRLKRIERTEH